MEIVKNVNIVIECPHCKNSIFIEQLNCGIFRHGVYKNNLEQIPPHSSKEFCDDLYNRGLIFGCSKPFQITKENQTYIISECDYI